MLEWLKDLWYDLKYMKHTAIWWVRYRTTNRNHVVNTGLKPGYYDKDYLMIHACFQLLVDYVEKELSHMTMIFASDMAKSRLMTLTPRERGLHHLAWEKALTEEPRWQAEMAAEKEALYLWWVDERPKRVDPFDLPGDGWIAEEERQRQEDEDMLIRLVKVRPSLWT